MTAETKNPSTFRQTVWTFLNSNFGLFLLSGVILAGIGKWYADKQASAADVDKRRAEYVELLAEYQHRVFVLGQADSELNPFIGEGVQMKGAKQLSDCGPDRSEWERLSEAVGQREEDILRGIGDYVPTSPKFARVDLLTLAARMEQVAGIPDIELGAVRMFGVLSTSPDLLWLFVRAYHPMMQKFGVTRHLLYADGEIPLERGAALTRRQQARLGWPEIKPGDLEREQRESDLLHEKIQRTLSKLEGGDRTPSCEKSPGRAAT